MNECGCGVDPVLLLIGGILALALLGGALAGVLIGKMMAAVLGARARRIRFDASRFDPMAEPFGDQPRVPS